MADKSGTLQQQRNASFPATPANATGVCPLNGPDVAIIPMRYALDRSRYDEHPKKLKPLLKTGTWSSLPVLKTRSYTLRQLRNGYVYVFDETEKTLHEYKYQADTAMLTRIKWEADILGKDERSSSGASKTHLLYPRKNTIRIAYSTLQWSWRICEFIRSNGGSRKDWMQKLDLKEYCLTMKSAHTLPLTQIVDAVADIDKGTVTRDKRFSDSAYPPDGSSADKGNLVPLASDVVWTGSVSDPASAMVIALDDPLAMLEDLNWQLIGDQAAYIEWQDEHQHKVGIAEIVDNLCGANGDKSLLPTSIAGNDEKKRQYTSDIEDYFSQLKLEDQLYNGNDTILIPPNLPSLEMAADLKKKYGSIPSQALKESWEARTKWRNQVDLTSARNYISKNKKNGTRLISKVNDTQKDLINLAQYIGAEPLRLFIDTTRPEPHLYLATIISEVLKTLGQDQAICEWLTKQDIKASTLLGLARFGFSLEIQSALTNEANKLVQGTGDITAIISRIGELNSFITHDAIADKAWMKGLTDPAKLTLKTITILAKERGKAVFEQTLLALLPVDSRLARSKQQNLPALLRNILVGHILANHKDRLEFDKSGNDRLSKWKNRFILAQVSLDNHLKQWHIPRAAHDRVSLGRNILKLQNDVQLSTHELPALLDYQNNKYAQILGDEIRNTLKRGGLAANQWQQRAKAWSAKYGIDAAAITWGVAIANLFNTAVTYNTVSKDGEISEKDRAKIFSSFSYTANALMAIFIETKWSSMKGLNITVGTKTINIADRSAKYWELTKSAKNWGKIIRGFSWRLVGLGGTSLLATGFEYWDIQDDLKTTSNKDERAALIAKQGAVITMSLIGAVQLLAGVTGLLGGSNLVAFAMNPWFAVAALIAGIVYLIATAALNYFKRDAIGQWLHKCTWSRTASERINDQNEENRSLLEIQMSPTIFVKPTFISQIQYGPQMIPHESKKQDGAWIQMHFPAELRGNVVRTNLAASHRPFYIGPVTKLDDQLQAPFLNNGQSVEATTFRSPPITRPLANASLGAIPPRPREGTSLVWQTWVPLTTDAQNVEIQIWYPIEILASGEGDRGYRYQLELDKEGVEDQKDSRISSLDNSTLVVQQLGGRNDAAVLPLLN
ncbi:hypothetical protein DXT77_21075 [Pseudomonas sp. 91RF]|uniref:T6SS effector BTH_I2691 family protein n=1 Tax=Pseudomonas sp. 91RF TaxID=2292261 RepID=UPI000E675B0C|nr:T6SS effector BTH_I2691 family protein [Pseudomonas sp. 91RF]RIJ08385.1 hypothetical protein DXT77_21075 [Pseudomonas sp. 91RF]